MCSLCIDALSSTTVYVVFCNVSIVFFYTSPSQLQRLIGNSTRGYAEGMRDQALFENELYIASVGAGRLVVLDTWNCMLREIVIGPDGPGDFRTASYRLFGTIVRGLPLCSALQQPRWLFPLVKYTSNAYFVFVNTQNGRLFQFYSHLRQTVPTNIYLDPSKVVLTVLSTTSMLNLYVLYTDNTLVTYSQSGEKCPTDYTSYAGSDCSQYVPWRNGAFDGYYVEPSGFAVKCAAAACSLGIF